MSLESNGLGDREGDTVKQSNTFSCPCLNTRNKKRTHEGQLSHASEQQVVHLLEGKKCCMQCN